MSSQLRSRWDACLFLPMGNPSPAAHTDQPRSVLPKPSQPGRILPDRSPEAQQKSSWKAGVPNSLIYHDIDHVPSTYYPSQVIHLPLFVFILSLAPSIVL